MVWAVLPLKSFLHAKQRLSSILSNEERHLLFQNMVEDVLDSLVRHPSIEQTIIVSDDPLAALLANRYGILCWQESSFNVQGLSPVVNAVANKLTSQGVQSMLVVHGDLPLLTKNEIERMVDSHQQITTPSISIVSDARRDGSNCVITSPPNLIPFQYGAASYEKHCASATKCKANINTLSLPGMELDIDKPDDLYKLITSESQHKHSLNYLLESGITERLIHMNKNDGIDVSRPDTLDQILANSTAGILPTDEQALLLADPSLSNEDTTVKLMTTAGHLRDQGFLNIVTYSPKIFIPLTHLCRDVCHYCTFAKTPKKIQSPYMSVDEVLTLVKAGLEQGCKEALFTLGEKPELRYSAARKALQEMGFSTTLEYVAHVAKIVFEETGILPHINAGCMTEDEIMMLRPTSASMGIMLESASTRLTEKGLPHYGSPDKIPAVRLQTIEAAGQHNVPFTSGILIGIGETRYERIESLLALRDIHLKYGHLQEIIVQNFRAKSDTKMAQSPEPDLNELLWTIAVTRIIFGSQMSIQAPPNLSPGVLPQLIHSGINDWGGVSPVTADHVNPEAPWPHLEKLKKETAVAGKYLQQRLTIYPKFALDGNKWLDSALQTPVLRMIDAEGYPRTDLWSPGEKISPPQEILQQIDQQKLINVSGDIHNIVATARAGAALSEKDIVRLFQARGDDLAYVCQQADQFRQEINGDIVSYVVNRNINYTNICYFKCQFCAFSKGKLSENLRGRPYDLGHDEISRRCEEAWSRGATEVCMQGGIHPEYTGDTYLDILKTVKSITPDIHIHAFSPLEVWQGAATLDKSLKHYLAELKAAGLDTLPGTAAEVLDDEVRAVLCPDKINTEQWLTVMETAHELDFKTTATVMYGHVEKLEHLARHLLRIRTLQQKTGGFTEFVPLPFVHMEAPLYLKGKARSGPTFREAILMHAVARLSLSPFIKNIQTSWVKMGEQGVSACLNAGSNDLGGTLMNETITRSAGAEHGQEYSVEKMQDMINAVGRTHKQRSTAYGEVAQERIDAAAIASPLLEVINTPAKKYDRKTRSPRQLIANG